MRSDWVKCSAKYLSRKVETIPMRYISLQFASKSKQINSPNFT